YLDLETYDSKNLIITLVNASTSRISINGLFDVGYAQSPIEYEIKGLLNANGGGSSEIAMPILVDVEKHLISLEPMAVYGAVVSKEDFASLFGLPMGKCYDIRATYKTDGQAQHPRIEPSSFSLICF